MSTDFELKRALQDVQSTVARIDFRVQRMNAGARERPGQPVVQLAAARLTRLIGDGQAADRLEEKALAAPAQTTTSSWAPELLSTGLPGFVLSLERRSALAAVLARSPQVSLLKVGAFRVPVAALAPPAVIVAEANAIPVQKGSFAALALTPFKLCCVLHYTEELQNASNIEAVTRTLLEQSLAAGMDAVAFSSSATGGLLAGVTPITASTATPLDVALREDLQNLINALTAPSSDTIFIMSPGRAAFASSVLPSSFAYSIAISTALPSATVVCVDPQGIAAALASEPRIIASQSAAVHESDVPLPLSATGSPATIASPLRSAFQTDTIFVRVVADMAWAARVGAVSAITAVLW